MTTRLYFDTSALIKEFVLEVGSDIVDKIGAAARDGRCQIITSVWSINEAIAVVDRLSRRDKDPLSQVEKQQIIATLAERIKDSSERSSYKIAPLEHRIIANFRILIDRLVTKPPVSMSYTLFQATPCCFFLWACSGLG